MAKPKKADESASGKVKTQGNHLGGKKKIEKKEKNKTHGGKKHGYERYIYEQRRLANKIRRVRRHVKRFPNDFASQRLLADAMAGKLQAHRPDFLRHNGAQK